MRSEGAAPADERRDAPVTLPKGGGAVRGIGETFAANPVTGTGTMTLPIAVSPGRSGFGPALALSYESAAGNGPFGFGWSLSLPSISRRTERGIPRYRDDTEPDTFLLAGAEGLVPLLTETAAGTWERVPVPDRTVGAATYRLASYRPRTEGTLARIERWTNIGDATDVCWRTQSTDNVTTWYGRTAESRIADPADPRRVFSWLVCQSHDDKGNVIVYGYRPEDSAGISTGLHELRRTTDDRSAQRYLKRIRYGNTAPFRPVLSPTEPWPEPPGAHSDDGSDDWHFEVVLDYGDHDAEAPAPIGDTAWPVRLDPFSTCRPGFEVRTYRICRRVLMFHHFPAEAVGRACVTRSTDLTYTDETDPLDPRNPVFTFLRSATQTGWSRRSGGYDRLTLPPVEFGYAEPVLRQDVAETQLNDLPRDGVSRWADLHGEGTPGVLTEQAGGWFYQRNLSPLQPAGQARLAPMEIIDTRPAASLRDGAQLADLAGDGRIDVVVAAGPVRGLYEHDGAEGWQPFRPFTADLLRDFTDPHVRLIDLDGDGHPDLVAAEDDALVWHPSLGEKGFGPGRRIPLAADDDDGPPRAAVSAEESLHLADLTGDGLTDLARIRNGEVSYWPNLGHGRFGARVAMDHAPIFDEPDQFDQRRLLLADIDGSGTTDLIYLHRSGIRVYFNRSGNSWSEPHELSVRPPADPASVVAVDLLGNGTACLVWPSPLPDATGRSFRYLSLMGDRKPHLLVRSRNNLGAETDIDYTPSTVFFLRDRRAGRPWRTRLPFPVHVVERVESRDLVSGRTAVTRYAYHHGHFDGEEREFCGFAMVETSDAESFGGPAELTVPPVVTRTWYHPGMIVGAAAALHPFHGEYYRAERHLPDLTLPEGLTAAEERECVRALRGVTVRQEVYADDGTAAAVHPYTVLENRPEVLLLQPRGDPHAAVFLPVTRESVSVAYERDPADPRVAHTLVLEFDEHGNARRSCAVVYGRRTADPALPAEVTRDQRRRYITYVEQKHTPDITRPDAYRLRVSYESRTCEITGLAPAGPLFTVGELADGIATADDISYEDVADGTIPQRRPVAHQQVRFRDDALDPLPLGQWDSLGLGYRTYTLALTPGVVAAHLTGQVSAADLTAAGYVGDAGAWWVPSGVSVYPADPAAHFYVATGGVDPLGLRTTVTLDDYHLLPVRVETVQAAWQVVTAVNDYRMLAPVLVTDPNGNRSAVAHDALGVVVATAVMGKEGSADGDTLADPTTRFEYDLSGWATDGRPSHVRTLARERHGPGNARRRESWTYFDGAGRVALTKAQARPGPALAVGPDGAASEVDADPRWVGTGRTVTDNKGNPVKQYEPYFSATHGYEDEDAVRQVGVTAVLSYDPLGRNTATLLPDGTTTRVEFTAWWQAAFDANDTVLTSTWYADRGSPDPATPEPADADRRAAWLAARHADTPTVIHADALGRAVYAVTDHGGGRRSTARSEMDLTGRLAATFDHAGRRVAEGFTAMAGLPVTGESAEKGRRWTFSNVLGAMVRSWDEHGRRFRADYDELHRPVSTFASDGTGGERLITHIVYGDRVPGARAANLLGAVHRIFDTSGAVRVPAYDFRGRPVALERVLAAGHQDAPDWSALPGAPDVDAAAAPLLVTAEVFSAASELDALDRPVRVTLPDATVVVPTYDEGDVLSSLAVQVGGAGAFVEFLQAQERNAKGQREWARYGNGLLTRCFHDPRTFRLTRLLTEPAGAAPGGPAVQDLRYTYDPVGNITELRDAAQRTFFFDNTVVTPDRRYEYDAGYQLIRATGRELAGPINDVRRDHTDLGAVPLPHANSPEAVRTYTEEYDYDLLGNLTEVRHRFKTQPGVGGGWTRRYRYTFDDTPGDRTNRLTATGEAPPASPGYGYDAHGNMTRMPHLAALDWNVLDQLRRVDLGGGGTAFYSYGTGGARTRTVIERPGNLNLEWIFLGAVTLFRRRRRGADEPHFTRWTVQIGDDLGQIAQADTKTRDDDGEEPANPLGVPLIRYVYADALGSAALETDESGTPISYEEYHPYGTTAYRSARPGTDLSLKRYRFSGKQRDDETGLVYFGARYYAPWLGRWTSTDPAGLVAGPNLYRYCANNPVMFGDADGTQEAPRSFGLPENIARVPQGATPEDISSRAEQLQRHVHGLGYRWWNDAGAENAAPVHTARGWDFGTFDAEHIPPDDPLGLLGTPGAGGAAATSAGATAMRNNGPGNTIAVPDNITDDKLARLQEGSRQRQVGRNAGPGNSTRTRRALPAQRQALAEFRQRSPAPGPGTAAGHRIDMQYDLTGRIGEHWRDYIRENGATNSNDGSAGYRLLRNEPQGVPAGGVARQRDMGRLGNSPRFRTGMRWGGGGLAGLGLGLSAYGLYRDVVEGDAAMGVGDAFGVISGGVEVYAFGATAFGGGATAVGGVTVGGLAAVPLGIALGGVALGVSSAVSGYRAHQRGDTAGAVAGAVGTVAGAALAAGGGIAVASALGVAMAPALVAAAPVLIAVGAVLAIGVGVFHAGRYFGWW
ncbi:SpvB/TcaC N-terminal domain-containing protein [Actinoplanes sp. NBRC 103695]|uniref:SpvB/TcaC N-terminal domain-containing protein n=1 Tax=Actinoplanes sp. NBRC 103695 TaxID=3032202 RepID=UPI0024A0B294|nr:SpvB/TcaC N-terminal domain-containing protein [Actinoplanes sp. NBRC 103695]GLY94445.1 hypothetical protein Acsp02_17010 [Actinoplanes sp. NBRC 103695]